ncbi:MAG: DUF4864 domain-containing protein [Alphaproteobacteria bacterium]
MTSILTMKDRKMHIALKKSSFLLAVLVISALALANQASAEEQKKPEKDNGQYVSVSTSAHSVVNDVIKEQLQAIRERNDRIAYELNTTTMREDYKDPQSFMRDLRRKKKSLYNHVDYRFLGSGESNSKFHKVMLTDKYGKSSIAMFKMEQGEDGEWKTRDIIILMSGDDPV